MRRNQLRRGVGRGQCKWRRGRDVVEPGRVDYVAVSERSRTDARTYMSDSASEAIPRPRYPCSDNVIVESTPRSSESCRAVCFRRLTCNHDLAFDVLLHTTRQEQVDIPNHPVALDHAGRGNGIIRGEIFRDIWTGQEDESEFCRASWRD